MLELFTLCARGALGLLHGSHMRLGYIESLDVIWDR
jgi:hypothetical protein